MTDKILYTEKISGFMGLQVGVRTSHIYRRECLSTTEVFPNWIVIMVFTWMYLSAVLNSEHKLHPSKTIRIH